MKEIFINYISTYPVFLILLIGLTLLLKNNSIVGDASLRKFWSALPLFLILTIASSVDNYYAQETVFTYGRVIAKWISCSLKPFIFIILVDLLSIKNIKLKRACYMLGGLNSILYATMFLQNVAPKIGRITYYFCSDNILKRGTFLSYTAQALCIFCLLTLVFYSIKRARKRKKEALVVAFIAASIAVILHLEELRYIDYQLELTIVAALIFYYLFLNTQISRVDPTTNLFNRQAFYSDIKRTEKNITGVVALDMNGLKAINDNIGHKAGDIALNALADAFNKGTKKFPKSTLYRTGGDEFTLLYYGDPEDIEQMCKVIRNFVDDTEYTCSVGFAAKEKETDTLEDLEKLADERMYADKAKFYALTGKDRRK